MMRVWYSPWLYDGCSSVSDIANALWVITSITGPALALPSLLALRQCDDYPILEYNIPCILVWLGEDIMNLCIFTWYKNWDQVLAPLTRVLQIVHPIRACQNSVFIGYILKRYSVGALNFEKNMYIINSCVWNGRLRLCENCNIPKMSGHINVRPKSQKYRTPTTMLTSASFSAELSVSSPQKIFIFII